MMKAEGEVWQRLEAERQKEREKKLAEQEEANRKQAELEAKARVARERDAAERAPLTREQFAELYADLKGLLKKKEFDAADRRYMERCIGKKEDTAACQFIQGYILLQKYGDATKKTSIPAAREKLEAAFLAHEGFGIGADTAAIEEIRSLSATALLPLLNIKGEDSFLEKEILENIANSEFSSSAQKLSATKRLAEIAASEARKRKAEEVAAEKERIQEQKRAEALEKAGQREEAERMRLEKIEVAKREAEARRGDGSPDDLQCKRLGHKPTTPNYNSCREDLSSRARREEVAAKDKSPGASFSMEDAKRKCVDLGFKPATEGYGKCVLQLSK